MPRLEGGSDIFSTFTDSFTTGAQRVSRFCSGVMNMKMIVLLIMLTV